MYLYVTSAYDDCHNSLSKRKRRIGTLLESLAIFSYLRSNVSVFFLFFLTDSNKLRNVRNIIFCHQRVEKKECIFIKKKDFYR